MEIEKDKALTTSYKAKTYYFCSEECKNKFEEEPEKYLKREVPE
jgi:YHS domain-containing protein